MSAWVREKADAPTVDDVEDVNRAEDILAAPQRFQFIDVSLRSRANQSKNRQLTRSHVTKRVREQQRKTQGDTLRLKLVNFDNKTKGKGRAKYQDKVDDPVGLEDEVDQHHRAVQAERVLQASTWATNSAKLSQKALSESGISALQTYKGKVTPFLHQLIHHHGDVVWGSFWPATHNNPPPLAVDLFSLLCNHPALFHATCYASATVVDLLNGSVSLTENAEIKMHKMEAIRLINEELATKGENVHEAIILSIVCLIREAGDILVDERDDNLTEVDKMSPFRVPLLQMQWQSLFSQARNEAVHTAGSRALVRLKGGMRQLRERPVITALSHNSLNEAAFDFLNPPDLEFIVLPELRQRTLDPNINVPMNPFDKHRGSALASLVRFGLTEDALAVMVEMLNSTVLVENFAVGALHNPDVLALKSKRDLTHYRLLSLPTGKVLSSSLGATAGFYECARLAAIMYATAVSFPMPRSTGVPQRLIKEIKSCVEETTIGTLLGGARHFFIWMLVLTGVAAVGLPERPWYEAQLIGLLTLEKVSRWIELKQILISFLWMDSACDEGAMELWDEIASAALLRVARADKSPTIFSGISI